MENTTSENTYSFTLNSNAKELFDMVAELLSLVDKINNFELKVYGYDPIEKSDLPLDHES